MIVEPRGAIRRGDLEQAKVCDRVTVRFLENVFPAGGHHDSDHDGWHDTGDGGHHGGHDGGHGHDRDE